MYNILSAAFSLMLTDNSMNLVKDIHSHADGEMFALINVSQLKEFYNEIRNKSPQINIIASSYENTDGFIESINEQISDKKIDMVILEPQFDLSVSEKPYVHVYEELIAKIQCSTLLMARSYYKLKDIGVLISGFYKTELSHLEMLGNLVGYLDAKLHLIYIVDNPALGKIQVIIQKLEEVADKYHFKAYTVNVIHHQNRIDGISFMISKKGLDLIAVLNENLINLNRKVLLEEILIASETALYCHF